MMIPSRFLERMASSEESTIAASRNREADVRLFDSPRAIMQAEKHKNPSIPKNWVRSLKAKECAGDKNQNHTPSVLMSVEAIDGPKPQYHAEKTTASQTVWYGFASPSRGTSKYLK